MTKGRTSPEHAPVSSHCCPTAVHDSVRARPAAQAGGWGSTRRDRMQGPAPGSPHPCISRGPGWTQPPDAGSRQDHGKRRWIVASRGGHRLQGGEEALGGPGTSRAHGEFYVKAVTHIHPTVTAQSYTSGRKDGNFQRHGGKGWATASGRRRAALPAAGSESPRIPGPLSLGIHSRRDQGPG